MSFNNEVIDILKGDISRPFKKTIEDNNIFNVDEYTSILSDIRDTMVIADDYGIESVKNIIQEIIPYEAKRRNDLLLSEENLCNYFGMESIDIEGFGMEVTTSMTKAPEGKLRKAWEALKKLIKFVFHKIKLHVMGRLKILFGEPRLINSIASLIDYLISIGYTYPIVKRAHKKEIEQIIAYITLTSAMTEILEMASVGLEVVFTKAKSENFMEDSIKMSMDVLGRLSNGVTDAVQKIKKNPPADGNIDLNILAGKMEEYLSAVGQNKAFIAKIRDRLGLTIRTLEQKLANADDAGKDHTHIRSAIEGINKSFTVFSNLLNREKGLTMNAVRVIKGSFTEDLNNTAPIVESVDDNFEDLFNDDLIELFNTSFQAAYTEKINPILLGLESIGINQFDNNWLEQYKASDKSIIFGTEADLKELKDTAIKKAGNAKDFIVTLFKQIFSILKNFVMGLVNVVNKLPELKKKFEALDAIPDKISIPKSFTIIFKEDGENPIQLFLHIAASISTFFTNPTREAIQKATELCGTFPVIKIDNKDTVEVPGKFCKEAVISTIDRYIKASETLKTASKSISTVEKQIENLDTGDLKNDLKVDIVKFAKVFKEVGKKLSDQMGAFYEAANIIGKEIVKAKKDSSKKTDSKDKSDEDTEKKEG